MRKFEQKQLLELIDTVKKAVGMLENIYNIGDGNVFLEILTGQQEAAISIGTRLDDFITRDADVLTEEATALIKETVQLLELYCELLWSISNTEGHVELRESVNILEEAIAQIEKNIHKMPVRLEVAFLPYKASMWDCMESVWMAAQEDLDCDAYVIPIPYFDRKPDGSAGQMHYEAALMPKKVPITDFRKYKIEERRPDVIYIHNPYDEYNHVTSVHPQFYSAELKKHTDMLVYIPYYMTDGTLPEGHSFLPAFENVDKIILQNENILKAMDSQIPQDKLVAFGSPKVDRILRLEKEREEIIESQIPQNWKKKIKGKKVILYNVSISGILQNSDTALEKMQYMINTLSKREDVVLLWRPHPLTEATLKSMRPELYQTYIGIRNRFTKEDKGIFDETGDAGIAATIADAYIGESTSSLVHYFGLNGKPLLFTDWNLTEEWEEEERKSLCFTDCYLEDGCAWFVPRSSLAYNYLCKMNLETGKVDLCGELPGEFYNPAKGNAYFGICKSQSKVILTPVWSNDIYLYDLETEQGIKIPLKNSEVRANFAKAFAYKDKFILQPRNYGAVVIVDMNTGKSDYYEIPDIKNRRECAEYLFGISSCLIENKLYFPCTYTNSILIFDLEKKEFSEYFVEETQKGFHSISNIDNKIWMIGSEKAEIFFWDMDLGEIKVWNEFPNDFQSGKQPFREIVDTGKYVLVFPEDANMILRIHKETGKIEEDALKKTFLEGERVLTNVSWSSNYQMVKKCENRIIAYTMYNNGLLQYDINQGTSMLTACRLEDSDMRKLEAKEWNRFYKNKGIPNGVRENKRWSVSSFVDFIVGNYYNGYKTAQKNYENAMANLNGECGKNIHDTIKACL